MLNFNRFDNGIVARAYNAITGNDIDRIDAIEAKDALNAGWLDEQTEPIFDKCIEFEKLDAE